VAAASPGVLIVRKLLVASLALAALPLPAGNALASGEEPQPGGEEAQTGGEELNLVPLDEIRVPIVDADRLDGTLRMKLVLQGKDAAARLTILEQMPVLRQAAVTAALEFARLDAGALRPVDARRLNGALTAALQRTQPAIGRVLMVEVAAVRG